MTPIMSKLQAALLVAVLAVPLAALADDAPAADQAAPEAAAQATPEAGAPDAATSQSDRMELVRAMRARMREMMQTQDPDKRKALMEAQINDMDAMMQMVPPAMGMGPGMGPGMGMGMGPAGKSDCIRGQGPVMGMGMGPGGMMGGAGMGGMMMGQKPCMTGYAGHCPHHDGADEQRLDALEKRMDMMQDMMRMMMRN